MSVTIIEAIRADKLFKPVFRDLETWTAWLTLLKAFFGLPMGDDDLALFKDCTGRKEPSKAGYRELWAVIGRRGGKSFVSAVTAVYLALFHDYARHLAPGERGVIQIIASDRSQAQVILRYVKGILHSTPVFEQYLAHEYKERVDLNNHISIEVMSCSFRSVRGRTLIVAIFDEIAFWMVDGASPDSEILSAVRPGMATIPTSKLIVISSPYARKGVLYEHHRDHFGKNNSDILVWQAPTRLMNPAIDQDFIDREVEKDPSAARAEYFAEFRMDIETFLSMEAVTACCGLPGDLAPRPQFAYRGFVDSSGGRSDAFTLGIGHQENAMLVVDVVRAWEPPFDPSDVVEAIAEILRHYRLDMVTGDRYGAAWVESAFEKCGIRYLPCDKAKSDLYLNLEGYINTQQIQLPEDEKLVNELAALERRRGRQGKDVVDHPPRGRDDRANVVAGLCYEGLRAQDLLYPYLRCGEDYGELSVN
ncbi:terminase large subunit domain-containing protein [Thermodesulfobacteriota bacterium]